MGRSEKQLVVAWGSWKEWDCVRAALFSSSPSRISAAIDRVAAWQSRGRVPVAVEITADIIRIHQRDPCIVPELDEAAYLPEEMLRLMYAMAIMRLVNGIVDDKAGPLASRALEADLPRFLVDIRHDSAHGELPALALSRAASKQALRWLEIFYWKKQKASLEAARGKLKSKVLDYFSLLRSSYIPYEVLQDQEPSRLQAISRSKAAAFQKLAFLSVQSSQDLVSILIDDGLLAETAVDPDSSEPETTDVDDLAWKYAISKLSHEMPELLQMLALGIVRCLCGLEAVADGTGFSFAHEAGSSSKGLAEYTGPAAKRLISWLGWLLNSHVSRIPKFPGKKSAKRALDMELQCPLVGQISKQLKRELLALCLRANVERTMLRELVGIVSEQVEKTFTGKYSRLVEFREPNGQSVQDKDAKLQEKAGEKNGNGFLESGELRKETGTSVLDCRRIGAEQELSSLELGLEKMKHTQQDLLSSKRENAYGTSNKSRKRRWKLADNWTPCAIGMLPSSCYFGGVRPPWLVDCTKELCSEQDDAAGAAKRTRTSPQLPSESTLRGAPLVQEAGPEVEVADLTPTHEEVELPKLSTDEQSEGEVAGIDSIRGAILVGGILQRLGSEALTRLSKEIRVL